MQERNFNQEIVDAVPSRMVMALISLAFCFPLSLVSLYYVAQTAKAKRNGDLKLTQKYSSDARSWAIISYVLGGLVWLMTLKNAL